MKRSSLFGSARKVGSAKPFAAHRKKALRQRVSRHEFRPGRRPFVESLERRDLLASYTTPEDTALIEPNPVLAGAIIQSRPLHGILALNNSGGFEYKPALNYNGPDRFTYVTNTTTGTAATGDLKEVSIDVKAVNDAPEALRDEFHAYRNATLTIGAPGVLKNDKDVDSQVLKAIGFSQPGHGTLVPNENGDGGFKYTPAAGYSGEDFFTYKATDGDATTAETKVSIYVKPLPDARDDYFSVAQNTSLTITAKSILTNDVPANTSFGLIATLEPGEDNKPKHGTVTQDTATGDIVYKPDAGYFGSDSFVYRATDATPTANPLPPAFDLARVFIYVRPVPTAVVANDDSYSTIVGKPLEIGNPGVLYNDFVVYATPTDPASNGTPSNPPGTSLNQFQLTAKLVEGSGPKHGTVTLKPQGGFVYVPNPNENYARTDTFVYTATLLTTAASGGTTETNTLSDTATVTINIRQLPDARDDQYTTLQNTVLTVLPKGVLTNDIPVAGHGLTAKLEPGVDNANGPKHGTVTLEANGSFVYKPNAGYYGPDSFVYRATDISPESAPADPALEPLPPAFDLATVYIYVRPSPIVQANPDVYSTQVNTALSIDAPGVLTNDHVLYFETTTGTLSGAADTVPTNPSLIATLLTVPPPAGLTFNTNGSFKYEPPLNFTGEVKFRYQASLPTTAASDTNTTSGSTSDSTSTYPNDPNRERHDITTVTIFVKPLPPPVANDDYYRMLEGTTLTIAAPGVLDNDRRVEDRQLIAKLDKGPEKGALKWNENQDGSFSYTPESGFSGYVSFTYYALDRNASPSPTPETSSAIASEPIVAPRPINLATVRIYVHPVHPRVFAGDDFYRTLEDSDLSIAAPGVLRNDSLIPPPAILIPHDDTTAAADSNVPGTKLPPYKVTLTAKLLGEKPDGLTFNSDGSFKYEPADGFTGAVTFRYEATATVTLPDPTDSATAATLSTAGVSTVHDAPCYLNSAGTAVCPPVPDLDNIATVTIYVHAPEPPAGPVAINDFYVAAQNTPLGIRAPGVLANDYIRPILTTSDGHILPPTHLPLKAVLVTGPEHGVLSLNPDGSFKYLPDPEFTGVDTFTYQANLIVNADDPATATDADGEERPKSNIATVTIRVVPAIAHGDSYRTPQDTKLEVPKPGVLANDDGGSEAEPLTATVLSGPYHGKLDFDSNGSFVYTPDTGYFGPDLFTYRAADGTIVGEPTANLTTIEDGQLPAANRLDVGVVKINVTPQVGVILANDDKFAARENTTLTIQAPGVLHNDYGPVNHLVIATLDEEAAHGKVVVNRDGSFTYTPNENFVGEDKFTYTASFATNSGGVVGDGPTNGSDTATVIIHVLAASTPPPKFLPGQNQRTTDESGPQKIAEWATVVDTDSDGQPATFTVTTDNPRLFAKQPAIDPTGQLVYTPAPNASGEANVTVTMNDGSETPASHTFTIRIDKPYLLHNTALACDPTGDFHVAPDDALIIINYINAHRDTPADAPEGESGDIVYYDVSKDGSISPIDALMVINAINSGQTGGVDQSGGEGEGATDMDDALLALVAQDAVEATLGRKRSS